MNVFSLYFAANVACQEFMCSFFVQCMRVTQTYGFGFYLLYSRFLVLLKGLLTSDLFLPPNNVVVRN